MSKRRQKRWKRKRKLLAWKRRLRKIANWYRKKDSLRQVMEANPKMFVTGFHGAVNPGWEQGKAKRPYWHSPSPVKPKNDTESIRTGDWIPIEQYIAEAKRNEVLMKLKALDKHARSVGDIAMGFCIDCHEPELIREMYIVRGAIWLRAGMYGWKAGCLHRRCIEKRLGRQLTKDDLLVELEHEKANGQLIWADAPDYHESPEYWHKQKWDRNNCS